MKVYTKESNLVILNAMCIYFFFEILKKRFSEA